MDTIDDDNPLGTVLPALNEEPQIQEQSKQTAKCGKPFGNPVRKPLQVKKCSVNLQREQDENTKPEKNKILETEKTTKNKKQKERILIKRLKTKKKGQKKRTKKKRTYQKRSQ